MCTNRTGAKMQKRLSMVVEGMRIKEGKMRIDTPYVTQGLMNLDIVLAEVI
jgi:hypothetical protein